MENGDRSNIDRLRLDTSANIYPAIATRQYPQVYRLSVLLLTRIDPVLLEHAVREVLPYFPVFQYGLHRGKRWCYLEKVRKAPIVGKLFGGVPKPFEHDGYAFHILYRGNEICLEALHVLTDGSGATEFLHAVCYRYCQLRYVDCVRNDGWRPEEIKAAALSDPYLRLPSASGHGSWVKMLREPKCYQIKSEQNPTETSLVNTVFTVPLGTLKKRARVHQVTVCEYLAAMCLYVLWMLYHADEKRTAQPIRLSVPVNLRPVFGIETGRNFFTCIPVEANRAQTYTPESMVTSVQEQFARRCSPEYLGEKIAGLVRGQSLCWIDAVPLWLKNLFLRTVYRSNGYSTMTISNLGKMTPREEFAPFIIGYRCMLPLTEQEPLKAALWSYRGELSVSIVYRWGIRDFEGALLRLLQAEGIGVSVEGWEGSLRDGTESVRINNLETRCKHFINNRTIISA